MLKLNDDSSDLSARQIIGVEGPDGGATEGPDDITLVIINVYLFIGPHMRSLMTERFVFAYCR